MAECLLHEPNRRLQDVTKNKNLGKMTVVQGLLDVASKYNGNCKEETGRM